MTTLDPDVHLTFFTFRGRLRYLEKMFESSGESTVLQLQTVNQDYGNV